MNRVMLMGGTMAAVLWASAGIAAAGGGGAGICLGDVSDPPANTVFVSDHCFYRPVIEVRSGEVVRWELRAGGAPHTVTFDSGPNSGDLEGPFAVRFDEPGTYAYFCRYHGSVGYGMAGKVKVTGPAAGNLGEPALSVVEGGPAQESTGTAEVQRVALEAPDPGTRAVLLRLDLGTAVTLVLAALAFGAAVGFVGRTGRRPG
ncbi:MAG: cupredoxin domain-containing protein [Actinomycetota bacterium]